MTQLFRILYCSRNQILGTSEAVAGDIDDILGTSRKNNAHDGVTGGLLFSEGSFAQVLEGPLDAIERAFERIQCDGRHSDVTVLQSGPIETRDFPDWSMAFTGANAASHPLASGALADAFSGQPSGGEEVLNVLKAVVARETEWLVAPSKLAAAPQRTPPAAV